MIRLNRQVKICEENLFFFFWKKKRWNIFGKYSIWLQLFVVTVKGLFFFFQKKKVLPSFLMFHISFIQF